MGVTIHFEGTAKSDKDLEEILSFARSFAINNNMPNFPVIESNGKLSRIINETDADYKGPIKGIVIEPHYNCEQLKLEFGKDLFMQDYCKTQFAPAQIHIAIIGLLKKIQPHFSNLTVVDEGEYWETEDTRLLEQNMSYIFEQIKNIKKENPNANGPFRTKDGRIIDIMQ